MVNHILHTLVCSAIIVEDGIRGYWLLMFFSSGDPTGLPRDVLVDVPGGSGTEFKIGWVTSGDKDSSATINPPTK